MQGDEVTGINKERAIDFLFRMTQYYMKTSGSLYSRMKGMAIYMCLYNPFDPITHVCINGGKRNKLQYTKAFKGLFMPNKGIMGYLRDLSIKPELTTNDINARFLKQNKLAYYDIHKFITHGPNLMKVNSLV